MKRSTGFDEAIRELRCLEKELRRESTTIKTGTRILSLIAMLLVLPLVSAEVSRVPDYNKILVVVEENHGYDEIVGNVDAPYINKTLIAEGASLTNYFGITNPSQPNYFALYAGDTFGADNGTFDLPDPSLYTTLLDVGRTFLGYKETGNNPRKHNPWQSFPESTSVEITFPTDGFQQNHFTNLPSVSFVIPNLENDMHDGTILEGDTWLLNNINAYAQWAKTHNSLLIVVFDEDAPDTGNHVVCVLYGARVITGQYGTTYNHYSLLNMICASQEAAQIRNAATAVRINGMFQ